MTNAELMMTSQRCGALSAECRDLADKGSGKVALQETAALPPDNCALGDKTPIVFRHGESSIGEADPPSTKRLYPLARAGAKTVVHHCSRRHHLIVPSPRRGECEFTTGQANDFYAASSLDARMPRRSCAKAGHSSFSRHMSAPCSLHNCIKGNRSARDT